MTSTPGQWGQPTPAGLSDLPVELGTCYLGLPETSEVLALYTHTPENPRGPRQIGTGSPPGAEPIISDAGLRGDPHQGSKPDKPGTQKRKRQQS